MKYLMIAAIAVSMIGCAVGTRYQVATSTTTVKEFNKDIVVKRLKRSGWRIETANSKLIETKWRRNEFNPGSRSYMETMSRITVRNIKDGKYSVVGDCMYRSLYRRSPRDPEPWYFRPCKSPYKALASRSAKSLLY